MNTNGEHPCLYTELRSAGKDGSNNLTPEHRARRYLHVMTELKITSEGQSLSHGDVSPGLEHHHCDRVTREGVTDDKLGNDVKTNLLVSDSLDHANGNDVHEGDNEREDEGPYWHL